MATQLSRHAKSLRSGMTEAEQRLWMHLRAHRLQGHKFKRQQPFGAFIPDFVCFEARLVIELDGSQHLENRADAQRDTWLKSNGFRVLRFWNDQVLKETEAVLEMILRAVEEGTSSPTRPLSPTPLPQGERGKARHV